MCRFMMRLSTYAKRSIRCFPSLLPGARKRAPLQCQKHLRLCSPLLLCGENGRRCPPCSPDYYHYFDYHYGSRY